MKKQNKKVKSDKRKGISVVTFGIITAVVILVISAVVAIIHFAGKKDEVEASNVPQVQLVKSSTIDFAENEAARFGDVAFSMEEFLLYAIPIISQYDEMYGSEIWTEYVTYEDGTTMSYEDYVKCDIIDTAACVKALSAKYAEDFGELSEDEEKEIYETAQTYYDALNENGVNADDIGLMTLYGYTYENYRAEKEYVKLFGEKSDPSSEEVIAAIAEIVTEFKGADFTTSNNVNWSNLDLLVLNPDRANSEIDAASIVDNVLTIENADKMENIDMGED